MRVYSRNEVIRVRPLGNGDVREVDDLKALALQALAAQFLLQGDVPFEGALVEQIGVRLEVCGKFADHILRITYPRPGRRLLRNVEIVSLLIEQLKKHPLRRLQPDEVISPGELGQNGRLSIFDLLLGDHPWI